MSEPSLHIQPLPGVTVPSAEVLEDVQAAGLRYVSDQAPGLRRRKSGKGFTYDASSPQDYEAKLAMLPFRRRLAPEQQELALRYARHFFFGRMLQLPFVKPQPGPRRFRIAIDSGADLCGPNLEVQTEETWRERGIEIIRGDPLPAVNELHVGLTNVAAVTIAVDRAGIDTDVRAAIEVTTDGAGRLTLTGLPPGQPVQGPSIVPAGTDGRAVVELGAGETVLILP